MQRQYSSRGLQVLAINLDAKRADADQFLAKTPAGFAMAFDTKGESARRIGVKGMPTSLLVAPRNLRGTAMPKGSLLIALGCAGLLVGVGAQAGLTGDQISTRWEFNNIVFNNSTITVGPGIELPGQFSGVTLDAGDNYIIVDLAPTIFMSAGVRWTFGSLDFGVPFDVTVDTSYTDFDASFVSWTLDTITFNNLQSLHSIAPAFVRFNLHALSVPEAPSLALVSIGLLGLFGYGKSKVVAKSQT